MIASSPLTPVTAAATGSVPLYDVPIMPTLPVDQAALTSVDPVAVVNPLARPFSQSITALGANRSGASPTVTQPCDKPVPGASECTTANPRGTQSLTMEFETCARSGLNGIGACDVRGGGGSPTSCFTSQSRARSFDVPA